MCKLPSSEAELNELLKKEKARGYSQGHAAGRKKLDSDVLQCAKLAQRADFIDAAFLAVLPACMRSQNWQSHDGKPIATRDQRVDLAWSFAKRAWQTRGY